MSTKRPVRTLQSTETTTTATAVDEVPTKKKKKKKANPAVPVPQPRIIIMSDAKEDAVDEGSITVPTETYSLGDQKLESNGKRDRFQVLEDAFQKLACADMVKLGLDHDEEQLFDTLLNTTLAYERGEISLDNDDNNNDNGNDKKMDKYPPQPLQVRVAGGWVRDKILGLNSHDVDITVDKMMGVQFATLIQKYLLSLPLSHPARCQTKYPKMGVIAANPEQSKHLETATMKVHNIDIDICHLRAEEIYQEDSRIPTVSIGTPLQDAQRRDFTLNAMFYNLKTKMVEDWTQRGMPDLRHRRLVTPLNAETTFQDDPLRVLRAIRFAVRYQLALDDGLQQACMLPKIHKALQVKVSRERVGKELEGMLSGKGANPQKALKTIGRLKLAGCVFCFPSANEIINKTQISAAHGTILGHEYQPASENTNTAELEHLRELGWQESQKLLTLLPPLYELSQQLPSTASSLDQRLFPLAAFLLPFRHLVYDEKKTGNSNGVPRRAFVTTFMFRESIKFKNKDVQAITMLMENLSSMVKFLTDLAAQQQLERKVKEGAEQAMDVLQVCRLEAGLILRSTKELWVTTLLLATMVKMREQQQEQEQEQSTDWLKLTAAAYKTILELNLEECWKAKPLLNGKAVVEALKLPRGPIISTYLEEQARWMLLHPDGTKEECEEHLHSVKRRRDAEGSDDGNPHSPHPRLK